MTLETAKGYVKMIRDNVETAATFFIASKEDFDDFWYLCAENKILDNNTILLFASYIITELQVT